MVRVPCSFNPKRKRYCIPIKSEDLTSVADLKKKSKKNNYRLKIYGNKFLDLTEFDKESDTHKYESINIDIPMDSVDLECINIDKFPECIKNALTESFLNHRRRFIIITYLKSLGLPENTTINLLRKYMDTKTWLHCVREENQVFWIYKRDDLFFPNCKTLLSEGFCIDKDCKGPGLY